VTTPNVIQFYDIEMKLDTGNTLDLKRCGKCMALVLPADAQEHADWHGSLTSTVRVSGMGFGVGGGLI
jgi:hypothetical protein